MQTTQNKLHFLSIYIVSASVLFLIGLLIWYVLPYESVFYNGIETCLIKQLNDCKTFSIFAVALSFAGELKYVLFAFLSAFSARRHLLLTLLVSYKGFLGGMCSACLMRTVKADIYNVNFEVIGCLVFVILTVATILTLCCFSVEAVTFSKKTVYPPKIRSLIKRKDTYLYLSNILAFCGIIFVIIFLKHGNLYFMVS